MMNHIRYLLIGNGRVACHFSAYLKLLNIPFNQWTRAESVERLYSLIPQSDVVLLAITDSAIENFYQQHLTHWKPQSCVHFSGCLEIPAIFGAHPLMTFGPQPYTLPEYQQMAFVTTAPGFQNFFPALTNAVYQIPAIQKARYHAHCVASGNFTLLLWQKMAQLMAELNIPQSAYHPYLQKVFLNIQTNLQGSLTGPLARKDRLTVQKNLQGLADDPLQIIYQSFLQVYFPENAQEIQK